MMFRKTLIATTAVAAIMSAAPSAFADVVANNDFGGGTINFTGSVTEAPCSIDPNDATLNINLGAVSQKMLTTTSTGSTPVDVVIHLNSCQFEVDTTTGGNANPHGKLSKVDVEFSGYSAADVNKGILRNEGDAANVGVQLLDNAGTPLHLDRVVTGVESTAQQLTGATGQMTFKARMLSTGSAATPGSVSAKVNYKLKYL